VQHMISLALQAQCVKWAKSVRGSGAASMTANLNKLDLRVSIVEYGFLS
jgi:hypothetical protein